MVAYSCYLPNETNVGRGVKQVAIWKDMIETMARVITLPQDVV